MNKKKIIKSVVASALCVAMVLSIILSAVFLMPSTTTQAAATEGNNFDFNLRKSDGSRVAISFIGDSITTYNGVSNNTDYNSTIGGNAVYYGRTTHAHYAEFADVKLADTWWMQTINTLDLDLCVNNSWSGSKIITIGGTAATQGTDGSGYYTRCNNLHNDKTGKKPDVIVVFLGTNDVGSLESTSKLYGTNTLETVDTKYTTSSFVPGTVVGAYATMIRRICANYPNAEIYCCTLLPQQDERLSNNKAGYDIFNAGVKEVVNGYATGKSADGDSVYKHNAGIYLVDFYNDSGIHQDKQSRENSYANRLHPNKSGMDAMSNLLISELMEHSKYMAEDTVNVSYDLANTYVEVGNITSAGVAAYGDVTQAVKYKPFQVKINAKGNPNIQYRVTMGGEDITTTAVAEDIISIPYVTGDITISAHEFDYFYWTPGKGSLVSNTSGSELISDNKPTLFYDGGTYTYNADNTASFGANGHAYKLAEPVNLLHDRNWEIEFRMSGGFTGGSLLFSYSTASDVWDLDVSRYVKENNIHLFRTGTDGMLAFGVTTERDNDKSSSVTGETYKDYYYHYGVGLTNASYGGNASFDVETMHTYRMFNVYDAATGGNTIYLSIDGGTAVAMTYAGIANKYNHANKTSTYEMSGRDLTFNAIGTYDFDRENGGSDYGHPVRNCTIEYIKVLENGDPLTYSHDPSNYYWEFQQSAVVSNPEGLQKFTNNQITMVKNSYPANGVFGNTTAALDVAKQYQLKLEEPAVLLASRPWILEFQGGGNLNGGILLTSELTTSNQGGNHYIHMNTTTVYVGMSRKNKTEHYNTSSAFTYETIAAKLGITANEVRVNKHIWRFQNVINPDGSNHIELYVDDVLIGDIVKAGTDWSGQDMIVNYLGTSNNYGLQNYDLDYLLIYENGIPKEVVTDEVDNFRWEATANGMTSVKDDGYFTENISSLKMGNGVNGVHALPSYYKLDQTVNLLHDRNWNVEWKASGSWGGTDDDGDDPMLFSSTSTPKKNMNYVWFNSHDFIAFGYWAQPGYNNYGINIADTDFGELNDALTYTFRLENRVERDANGNYVKNMVYLYIDGIEIGAMDNYYANGVDQNKKDEWISGKDFAFNYIGNDTFPLVDVNFEYIQIWEDGSKLDTARLEYLLYNWSDPGMGRTAASWSAFVKAWNASRDVLTQVDATQEDVDRACENLMIATNGLVITTAETNTIYSAELVTGDYARVGKQVGVKVITSPDIAQICIGTQKLLSNSAKIQKMVIDGEEKIVKVWMLSFKYGSDTSKDGGNVTFGIGAWSTYSADHDGLKDSNPNVYTSLKVNFRSYFVTSIEIENYPDRFIYGYKDEFDPTGMIVRAYYSNGSSEQIKISNLTVRNPILYPGDQYVTIEYQGAVAQVEVMVLAEVSQAGWFAFDINDPDLFEYPTIWVQGVYMGYVADVNTGIYEAIIRDLHTDKMLAVQYWDYDEMMGYFGGFMIGDPVYVNGSVYVDAENYNKTYMINAYADYAYGDVDMSEFVLDGINSADIHHQQQLSDLFTYDTIDAYRYVQFKGTMYLHRTFDGEKDYYTIHFVPDATGIWDMAGYNEGLTVQLSDEAYMYYYGESILESLYWEVSDEFNNYRYDYGEDPCPGIQLNGTIRALFTHVNDSYQLVILDGSWVDVTVTDIYIADGEIYE